MAKVRFFAKTIEWKKPASITEAGIRKNRLCEKRSDGLKTKERFFAKEAQNDHKLAYEKKPASVIKADLRIKFYCLTYLIFKVRSNVELAFFELVTEMT